MSVSSALEIVNQYLPESAKESVEEGGYGWTDEFIENLMTSMAFGPAQTVRYFWYQRTVETAEYLDAGKPLTQIHKQAKEMLDYWDNLLRTNPGGMEPPPNPNAGQRKPISFGEIERPVGYDSQTRYS